MKEKLKLLYVRTALPRAIRVNRPSRGENEMEEFTSAQAALHDLNTIKVSFPSRGTKRPPH